MQGGRLYGTPRGPLDGDGAPAAAAEADPSGSLATHARAAHGVKHVSWGDLPEAEQQPTQQLQPEAPPAPAQRQAAASGAAMRVNRLLQPRQPPGASGVWHPGAAVSPAPGGTSSSGYSRQLEAYRQALAVRAAQAAAAGGAAPAAAQPPAERATATASPPPIHGVSPAAEVPSGAGAVLSGGRLAATGTAAPPPPPSVADHGTILGGGASQMPPQPATAVAATAGPTPQTSYSRQAPPVGGAAAATQASTADPAPGMQESADMQAIRVAAERVAAAARQLAAADLHSGQLLAGLGLAAAAAGAAPAAVAELGGDPLGVRMAAVVAALQGCLVQHAC